MIEEKRFPKPCSLGARAKGWRVADIEEWLNNLSPKPEAQGE